MALGGSACPTGSEVLGMRCVNSVSQAVLPPDVAGAASVESACGRPATALAAPESLRMKMMKDTAPTESGGCIIDGDQEAIMEMPAGRKPPAVWRQRPPRR